MLLCMNDVQMVDVQSEAEGSGHMRAGEGALVWGMLELPSDTTRGSTFSGSAWRASMRICVAF